LRASGKIVDKIFAKLNITFVGGGGLALAILGHKVKFNQLNSWEYCPY